MLICLCIGYDSRYLLTSQLVLLEDGVVKDLRILVALARG